MVGFGIDEIQAEYVAEIKLRHLNREYILNRLNEIESLEKEISEMEDILSSKNKVRSIIVSELKEVIKKYSKPRNTMFFYKNDIEDVDIVEEIPDYPVNLFINIFTYINQGLLHLTIPRQAYLVIMFRLSLVLTREKSFFIWLILLIMKDICFSFLKTEKLRKYH